MVARAARRGVLPRGLLELERDAPTLRRLLREQPGDQGLALLLMDLLGWEVLLRRSVAPGHWWSEGGRLGTCGDHHFDRETGMPLAIEIRAIGLRMRWIPSGSFSTGSTDPGAGLTPDRFPELPVRRVRIPRGFWMSEVPLRRGQYWHSELGPMRRRGVDAEKPMEFAESRYAQALLDRTTEALRRAGRIPEGARLDLPSEAEWEYACRSGSETDLYSYPVDDIAWHAGNSSGKLQPVGGKLPNHWGLHDMLGNIREWCRDPWTPNHTTVPPRGEARIQKWYHSGVARGGSCETPRAELRCSLREEVRGYRRSPGRIARRAGVGLRVLLRW